MQVCPKNPEGLTQRTEKWGMLKLQSSSREVFSRFPSLELGILRQFQFQDIHRLPSAAQPRLARLGAKLRFHHLRRSQGGTGGFQIPRRVPP